MKELWIDPSYTGTGCFCVDNDSKEMCFALFGNTNTKRSMINYYKEAKVLVGQFAEFLNLIKPDVVYLEYPPPFGSSAAGLYGLQFLLLDEIFKVTTKVYGINPRYVSSHVKKYKDNDSTSIRKKFAIEVLEQYKQQGYKLDNSVSLLKKAGCDVQTAILFKYMSNLEHKEWLSYQESL